MRLRPIAFWMIGEGRLVGSFVVEFALGVLLATILLHKARSTGLAFEIFVERVGGTFGKDIVERSVLTIRSTVFGLFGVCCRANCRRLICVLARRRTALADIVAFYFYAGVNSDWTHPDLASVVDLALG